MIPATTFAACRQLFTCFTFLSCLLALGCRTPKADAELVRVSRSQPLLGTFVTITAYGEDRERVNDAVSAAFDEFRRIDGIMSIHREDTELSRVNAKAAHEKVPISDDLYVALAKAQEIARQTDGAFDVTIRPLAELWGFIWKEYRLPTEAELAAVLSKVDWKAVELDKTSQTVSFSRENVSIDLGGIGKGYAVDCAIQKLQKLGIEHALVKAGGDLRVIGRPPGEKGWTVQLEDPRKKGGRVSLILQSGALSTSGNYENFFVVNGRRYSHILNPRTGLPVEGIASCTVLAATSAEADAWATALFVYGAERSIADFGDRFPMLFTTISSKDGRLETIHSKRFPVTTNVHSKKN